MAIFKNGKEIAGGGAGVLKLTKAEYEAKKSEYDSSGNFIILTDVTDEGITASNVSYSGTTSGLSATTVQGAIDEVVDETVPTSDIIANLTTNDDTKVASASTVYALNSNLSNLDVGVVTTSPISSALTALDTLVCKYGKIVTLNFTMCTNTAISAGASAFQFRTIPSSVYPTRTIYIHGNRVDGGTASFNVVIGTDGSMKFNALTNIPSGVNIAFSGSWYAAN